MLFVRGRGRKKYGGIFLLFVGFDCQVSDLGWDDEFWWGHAASSSQAGWEPFASWMEGVSYDWRAIMRVVKVNLRDISNGLWHFKKMGANDLC